MSFDGKNLDQWLLREVCEYPENYEWQGLSVSCKQVRGASSLTSKRDARLLKVFWAHTPSYTWEKETLKKLKSFRDFFQNTENRSLFEIFLKLTEVISLVYPEERCISLKSLKRSVAAFQLLYGLGAGSEKLNFWTQIYLQSWSASPQGLTPVDPENVVSRAYTQYKRSSQDFRLLGENILLTRHAFSRALERFNLGPNEWPRLLKLLPNLLSTARYERSDREVSVYRVPQKGASPDWILVVGNNDAGEGQGRFLVTLYQDDEGGWVG